MRAITWFVAKHFFYSFNCKMIYSFGNALQCYRGYSTRRYDNNEAADSKIFIEKFLLRVLASGLTEDVEAILTGIKYMLTSHIALDENQTAFNIEAMESKSAVRVAAVDKYILMLENILMLHIASTFFCLSTAAACTAVSLFS